MISGDRGYYMDFPDGRIEFVNSGAVTGPDQVGGQHFGTTYLYVRLNGGPWHRCVHRSWAKAGMEAERHEVATEAFKAIAEDEV